MVAVVLRRDHRKERIVVLERLPVSVLVSPSEVLSASWQTQ